jgi:pyridoxine 5-phosphate synthase
VVSLFKKAGIRTSIFVDPDLKMIEGAKATGTDRIELYTEEYARLYSSQKETIIKPFSEASKLANKLGLGVNAGHDLSLENLAYFKQHTENLLEVSIGHALISDSIYFGLENTNSVVFETIEVIQTKKPLLMISKGFLIIKSIIAILLA